jgi:hypothetical protein
MNPLLIAPVLEIGKSLIDRFFPDPAEKAKAEMDMMLLLQTQDLQRVIAQLEVNAKEAASPHLFVSGWRPAVGWCCGAGFLWATIGQPVFSWVAVAKGWPAPPQIDTEILLYVLGGMLGLGSLRSIEKVKGAAK